MCFCLDQIDEATPEDKAWWRPPYRKRSVFITCFVLCGVLMVPSILIPAFAEYFPGTLITAFVLKAMLDLWRDRKSEQTAPAETRNPLAPATTEEPLLDQPSTPKPRLYFLDNIKTLLTVIVITHHTTGAYAGTGWTYGIGNYANSFASFGRAVMTLDQAYISGAESLEARRGAASILDARRGAAFTSACAGTSCACSFSSRRTSRPRPWRARAGAAS